MKTKILVTLLVMLLLSAGFGSQVTGAEGESIHPRLYFDQDDLDYLRELRTAPSHQAMWNNIKSWADAHINDSPPGQSQYYKIATQIREYLETMSFAFAMTEDPIYANAAKSWMLSVASWSSWGNYHFICITTRGFAFGYDVLYDYLTPSECETIRSAIVTNVSSVYSRYNSPDFAPYYAGTITAVASTIGLSGLVLEGEYSGASAWIDFGVTHAERALSYGGRDGGWYEGEGYGSLATSFLVTFLDALENVRGVDLFNNEFLRQTPYYYIYCSYNGKPLQFEDHNWREGFLSDEKCQTSFLYKLASEYNNSYSQWFADNHADQSVMQSYIWKDPNLTATPPTDLPLTKQFTDLGYVILRDGWGPNDLLFAFKSGTSRGHAHNSQNEFGIYYQGKPITCGPGYVCTEPNDDTWSHNCILVDGLGQAQEPGDYRSAPLGTKGRVTAFESMTANYSYLQGDASPVYTGWSGTSDGRTYSVGSLKEWLRNVVFLSNPDCFVIFDQLEATSSGQFSYILNLPLLRWHGPLPGVSVDGNLVYLNQEGIQIKAQVFEPSGFTYQITSYQQHSFDFGQANQIRISTPTAASTAQFLIAIYPNEVLPAEEVEVGNCLGIVITIGNNKDLILFSADGNPVNEYVELGGIYRATDGGSYVFEETGVRVQFDNYQVLRLTKTSDVTPLVITSMNATNITTSSATITWATDESATSQVEYGTTEELGLSSELDTSLVTDHSVTLSDLTGSTIYYYMVKSEDASGNVVTSGIYNFTTGSASQPPALNPIGDKLVSAGELLQFTISATDPDDDSLTYSASNLPQGASFNPQTRTFSWTPDEAGTYPNVHFEVSDGSLTDSEDITITVGSASQPPVLNPIGDKSVNAGELLQFTISATDPDDDSLTYSASNLPQGASFNPQTRTFSWIPVEGGIIYSDVHFEVSDGSLTDSEDITITVISVNLPPILNPIGDKSVSVGELLQFTIYATDPDDGNLAHSEFISATGPDDSLTYSASNLPQGASFDPQTRTFSWTPDEAGTYPDIHFEVSDGSLTDSEDITITVNSASQSSEPNLTSNEQLRFTISATDDDSLTYSEFISATDPAGEWWKCRREIRFGWR